MFSCFIRCCFFRVECALSPCRFEVANPFIKRDFLLIDPTEICKFQRDEVKQLLDKLTGFGKWSKRHSIYFDFNNLLPLSQMRFSGTLWSAVVVF